MPPCSVRGCVHSKKTTCRGVMCMRVPKNDVERRQSWSHALCRDLTYNYDSVRVCELHFTPNDWEKTRQDGKKKLKQTAVPSMNLPSRIPSRNITYLNTVPSILKNNVIVASSGTEDCSPQVHCGLRRPDHSYSSATTSPITPASPLTTRQVYSSFSQPDHSYSSATTLTTSPPSTAPSASKRCLSPDPLSSSTPVCPKCGTVQDPTYYLSRVQELEKELSLMKCTLKEIEEKIIEKDKSLDKWTRENFSLRRRLKAERRTNVMLKKRDALTREKLKHVDL